MLDEGLICHLGVIIGGSPVVLPTSYARSGDTLYLHGSTGALSLRSSTDADVSVTVTLLDGIVYARSVMHFSMNYRSAVIHGRCREVGADEKLQALERIVEHLAPGSWSYARLPSKRELAATAVLALDLTEASVKMRTGGPGDDAADIETGGVWAGVVPLRQLWGEPIDSPDLEGGIELPAHVQERVVTMPAQ